VFSSLRTFRDDLVSVAPDHFVCVPLVLDTLHSKVGPTAVAAGGASYTGCCCCCCSCCCMTLNSGMSSTVLWWESWR
jgi:hypothetical protein